MKVGEDSTQVSPPAGSMRFSSPVIILLAGYVVTRLATFLVALFAHYQRPDLRWKDLLAPGDSGYYIGIATRGYPETVPTGPHAGDGSVAFFPGYPLLIRGVAELFHVSLIPAGIVVNIAIGAAVTVVGFRLAIRYIGERDAFLATLLFICLPGTVVFSFPYADALLLLLCMMSLLFLADERWLLAGLAGALATATRANGLGLVLAAIVASLIAIHQRRQWSSLAAPALVPLGMIAYFVFLWRHTGDLLAWFHVQRAMWGQKLDFGRGFLGPLRHDDLWQSWAWWHAESGLVLLALTLWSAYQLQHQGEPWRPLAVPYLFAAAVLSQMFLYSSVGFRPRFLLVAFPICWIIARKWSPRVLHALAAVLALTALPLAYVYVTAVTVP